MSRQTYSYSKRQKALTILKVNKSYQYQIMQNYHCTKWKKKSMSNYRYWPQFAKFWVMLQIVGRFRWPLPDINNFQTFPEDGLNDMWKMLGAIISMAIVQSKIRTKIMSINSILDKVYYLLLYYSQQFRGGDLGRLIGESTISNICKLKKLDIFAFFVLLLPVCLFKIGIITTN